jgi:hypothetical protein
MQTNEEVTIHAGEATRAPAEAPRVARPASVIHVELEHPEVEVSSEVADKAHRWVDHLDRFLLNRTDAFVQRMAERPTTPEAADPTLGGGYQYWNVLTAGPIQFSGNPPYRPSKIIAFGEPALMLGVIWINPANGPGGSLPGTVVLGNRRYRAAFETINLSDVTNGPDRFYNNTFLSPAPILTFIWWWMRMPDPGLNPNLYECTLTCDIVEGGQPFAAFSTWHLNPDREPAFLQFPAVGPGWQHERPARFLVYRLFG